MTDRERKIEQALERFFRGEGWNLVVAGDHFAISPDDQEEVNLSRLAEAVAIEAGV